MCLGGGGGGGSEEPRYLGRNTDPQPGPGAPPDMINNIAIKPKHDRKQVDAEFGNKPKLKTHSDKNTGLY